MRIIEKGHEYIMDTFDGGKYAATEVLRFFKRIGDKYPGNTGEPHPGTNCQEVLRALIDRVMYLDNQMPAYENKVILRNLRNALVLFEIRAAKQHNVALPPAFVSSYLPEEWAHCRICGHIICEHLGLKKELSDNEI